MSRQLYRLLETDVAYLTAQDTFNRLVFVVLDDDFWSQGCGRIGQSQGGLHERVLNGDLAGSSQIDIVVDTDVASADGRNPVPADGGMECRIVGSQDTSVEVGVLFIFFLHRTDVCVLYNLYGQYVLAGNDVLGYIVHAADKGTFHQTKLGTVQVDVGFPVDTVEVQEQAFLLEAFGHFEFIAIPEVGVEERFGDLEDVVGVVRIRHGTDVLVAGQDGARYGCHNPVVGAEIWLGDAFAIGRNRRSTLQHPVTSR